MLLSCCRRSYPQCTFSNSAQSLLKNSISSLHCSPQSHGEGRWSGDFSRGDSTSKTLAVAEPSFRFIGNREKLPSVQGQIVYGSHVCVAALVKGNRTIHRIYAQKDGSNMIADKVKNKVLPHISPGLYDRVTAMEVTTMENMLRRGGYEDANHQGIAMDVSPIKPSVLKSTTFERPGDYAIREDGGVPVWMLVENISDVREFGAMIRGCQFLGVDRLIVPQMEPEQFATLTSGIASKASSGALELIEMWQLSTQYPLISFLKDASEHFNVVYTTEEDKDFTPLSEAAVTKKRPLLFVVQDGVSVPSTLAECDYCVGLPVRHRALANKGPLSFSEVENVKLPLVAKIATILQHFISHTHRAPA
eukprot:scpid33991/ scgid0988/ rRNA methyltransferase 1, mitochondrial; Mitochondrial large ribosomal RNA ribose methylase